MTAEDSDGQTARWKSALAIAAGGLFGVVLVLAFILTFLHSKPGLEQSADRIERLVTRQVPGHLEIGALENLDLFSPVGMVSVTAHDLVFKSPNSREVMRLDRARIHFDATALFSREIHIERADIDGGTVTIEKTKGKRSQMEQTFADPGEGETGKQKPRPYAFDLRALRVEGMNLVVSVPSREIRVRDIEGYLGIFQTRWAEGATVKFHGMSAKVEKPELLGDVVELWHVNGEIRGARDQVADFEFKAKLLNGRMDGGFELYPARDKPVHLTLEPDGALLSIASFGANLRTELGGNVAINLK